MYAPVLPCFRENALEECHPVERLMDGAVVNAPEWGGYQ